MVLLAVLPLFYVYGVDAKMWREITSASLPFDEVWGGTVGTLVGAWLGAVPIPLDWYVQVLALVIFALKGGSGDVRRDSELMEGLGIGSGRSGQ